jgi:hypothetical protein
MAVAVRRMVFAWGRARGSVSRKCRPRGRTIDPGCAQCADGRGETAAWRHDRVSSRVALCCGQQRPFATGFSESTVSDAVLRQKINKKQKLNVFN